MGTEFDRLMRLAEQNTLDIQRISLEKKRQAGMAVDPSKRRKVEIEQRVRQREAEERVRREGDERRQKEKDERQRLEKRRLDRVEADKRQQRLDAEKRLDREKRVEVEKRQKPNVYKRQTKVVCPPPVRAESRDRPKQPLSYDELMRIASNKSSPVGAAPSAKASASAKASTSAKTLAPAKASSVRTPACAKKPLSAMNTEPTKRPTARPVKSAVSVNNAVSAKRLASERHNPAARRPVQPQPRRRDEPMRNTKAKAPEPEPRVRKAPEREIDRFGVRSTARQPAPRRDPVSKPHRATSTPISSRPRPPPRADKAKKQVSKHYDEASEYDSMDDFIVEDEDDEYRAGSIRAMFGVRYRDVDDDDDDDMEVSAVQLMREDRRSARIGRLEDEEEERKLAEEARRHVY
ncbi:hypothetical protein GGH15_001831 [Coemansia sp. RSA 562]|nr:hypothetical protein GGH15_001831 [Coemansia sp. RSA 562]KAJ2245376.1 hypothetical protein GGH97_002867 [Coemansia sp. RSA 475]